jgi:hypothetical protein
MSPYFDVTYEVMMPIQPEKTRELIPQLKAGICQQKRMPVLIWPDQPEGSDGIRIQSTQHGVAATFTTESENQNVLGQAKMLTLLDIEDAVGAPRDYGPHVRPTSAPREAKMPLSRVIQLRTQNDSEHDKIYAIYEAGAAYQIPGDVLIQELENPLSSLFSSNRLTRLSLQESQDIQNFESRFGGPNYGLIWAADGRYGGYKPGGVAEAFMLLNMANSLD